MRTFIPYISYTTVQIGSADSTAIRMVVQLSCIWIFGHHQHHELQFCSHGEIRFRKNSKQCCSIRIPKKPILLLMDFPEQRLRNYHRSVSHRHLQYDGPPKVRLGKST